jgi:hypothetical protein
MPITVIPAPPLRSQGKTQSQYSSEFEAFATALPLMATDFNAAATLAQLTTTTTSSSSVLIGTGAKTFTVAAGLGFVTSMTLRIGNSSTNYMTADVTSYSSTTLNVNVTAIVGSGTFASWAISLAAVGANTAGTVAFTPAGNIAATNVQSAIQELDTEKLSSAAGAVTGTNLEDITSSETVGSAYLIPVVTKDVNGRVTSMTSAQKITSGTVIATTSGTSHDYLSIPAGVKRITLMLSGVSTSGTSPISIQLGDSGGVEITGYLGSSSRSVGTATDNTSLSAGFTANFVSAAANVIHGAMVITLLDSTTNTWVANGALALSNSASTAAIIGTKALSAALDRIRLTTVAGTDTFDAGSINILLE